MKTSVIYKSMIFSLLFILSACSKDDDSNAPSDITSCEGLFTLLFQGDPGGGEINFEVDGEEYTTCAAIALPPVLPDDPYFASTLIFGRALVGGDLATGEAVALDILLYGDIKVGKYPIADFDTSGEYAQANHFNNVTGITGYKTETAGNEGRFVEVTEVSDDYIKGHFDFVLSDEFGDGTLPASGSFDVKRKE